MNKLTYAAAAVVLFLGACGVAYTYTHEKQTTQVVKDMKSKVDTLWEKIPPYTKDPPLVADAISK